MRIKNHKRTWTEDLDIIRYLEHHDVKDAALQFKTSEAAIRSWLHRIRRRIGRMQGWLNSVRSLQKRSPRVRKLTTDGSISTEDIALGEEEKWKWEKMASASAHYSRHMEAFGYDKEAKDEEEE